MIQSFEEISAMLSPDTADAWEKLVGHIRVYYKMDELRDGKYTGCYGCGRCQGVSLYLPGRQTGVPVRRRAALNF